MEAKYIQRVIKSLKYKDYQTAIYFATHLSQTNFAYKILLPICLYTAQDYSRALFYLKNLNTYTSKFYEALCYREKKDYSKAVSCIKLILDKKLILDTNFDPRISELYTHPDDTEYFHCLLGNMYTKLYDRNSALSHYTLSFLKEPLFSATESLLNENRIPIENTKENAEYNSIECNPLYSYALDCLQYSDLLSSDLVHKHLKLIPGLGTYFISFAAKKLFDYGMLPDSKKLFESLRKRDPYFISNLDYYSTVLWYSREISDLGVLCKDLIICAPHDSITWKALGNYYSNRCDYQKSVKCFRRSLLMDEDHYTYTLLGFESIQKNEYDTALKYFLDSLKVYKENYKAYFGCGVVYSKTENNEKAEFYYKKALDLNSKNIQLKTNILRFYIKISNFDAAICVLCDSLCLCKKEVGKIVENIEERKGRFSEIEERLLLEFVEILAIIDSHALGQRVLDCIEYRGEAYYRKLDIIHEKSIPNHT